jgi:hypothetical protein
MPEGRYIAYVGTPQLPYYHVKSVVLRLTGSITVVLTSPMPALPDIEIVSTLVMVMGGTMRSSKAFCLSDKHTLSDEMERVLNGELSKLLKSVYEMEVKHEKD